MSITTGVKVPTSYKNLREPKIHGITWYVVAAWGLFFCCAAVTGIILIIIGLPKIPAALIPMTVFGTLAFITVRDKQHCRQTWKHIVLLIRTFRSKTVFKKYTATIDDIKKVVPIELVEDNGLIQYINGTTARIIRLHAPRVSDDEIDQHNKRIMSVINSLYGDFSFQFVTIASADHVNYLASSTVDHMNRTGQTQPVNEHLYSIYDYATKRTTKEIDRDEYMFVYFSVTEKNSDAFMSGLMKELTRSHIIPELVPNRNQVISILRRMLTCNS